MIQEIKKITKEYINEVKEIRRFLHSNPELSFEEEQTSTYIAGKLRDYGIDYRDKIAKTGIIGMIKGKNPGKKVIALRADMDALPIQEENDVIYKSQKEGVMHACGHDAHTACLLGAAKILKQLSGQFEGTIKLIFQPSEEKFPGGALAMIKEGALKNPSPESIIGQHVLPSLQAGKVGFRTGKYMASTDEIYLTVKGKGGHAATPDMNIDSVLIASQIIVALQQIVSRNASPEMPTVLSFGRIIGNGRTNIIPSEVKIDGTFRTFNEKWRAEAHNKITQLAQGIARSMGGECKVLIDKGYPFLVNDKPLTNKAFKWAKEYLGEENVVELGLRMTAEDFAYYAQQMPGCFYRLGVRNDKKGITSNLHTPTFNIDENSLEAGTGLMVWLAIKNLSD